MKKMRPNHKITFITFGILLIALEFLLWAIMGIRPWQIGEEGYTHNNMIDVIYTVCAIAVIAIALIWYIHRLYYMVDEKKIVVHSGKIKEYRFKDIIYLDEAYSKKHIDAKMYIVGHGVIFLTMDRKKELLEMIMKKSPLISLEELKDKYPNLNI